MTQAVLVHAILLWIVVAWGMWLLRHRSPLHWTTVSLVSTAIIGAFYPIASQFVTPASWRNLSFLQPDSLLQVQRSFIAYAVGLGLMATIARRPRHSTGNSPRSHARDETDLRDGLVAAGLVVGGAFLYALYVRQVGLGALIDRQDHALKYLVSQGLGPLQFGLSMMIAGCLWAEDSTLSRHSKHLFGLIAAGIVVWALAFIQVRMYAVAIGLGYLYIHAARRGWELRRVRPLMVVLLAAGYLALESIALLRSVHTGGLLEGLGVLEQRGELLFAEWIGGSELGHPFVTAAEVVQTREAGELAGRSLVDGVLALAPLGLFPDRPLTLSEQFAWTQYTDVAARGGGTAFSLVAEGWLDFGAWAGPLAFGLALGGIASRVERARRTRPGGALARLAPYFLFYVAMQHRNEFATLLKQAFQMALVVGPIWLCADTIQLVLSRRATVWRARQATE